MKTRFIFFKLVILISLLCPFHSLCPQSLPDVSSTCSTAATKTITDMQVSTGQTNLCISFQVKIADACPPSGDINYLTVQVYYDGHYIDVLSFYYSSSAQTYRVGITDTVGTPYKIAETTTSASTIDTWTAFAACIDFSANTVKAAINSPDNTNEGTATPNFAGLSFASNSIFNFCADGTGTAFSCQVQFLTTSAYSSTITSVKPYIWGTSPTLKAFYKVNEVSGTSLADSLGKNGVATLSTSGTTASSFSAIDMGVQFTDTAQYISVPAFAVDGLNSNTPISFSVSVWVKLAAAPSSTAYIFRFGSSDLSKVYLAVTVDETLSMSMMLGSNAFYQGQSMTIGTWTLVTAGFSVKSDLMSYMASLSLSSAVSATAYSDFKREDSFLMPAMSLGASNIFKVGGGFIGHVYQFKLFSPGMHIMSSPSCSTNGKADFGILSSPITSLYTCDTSCKECSDNTNKGCMSCANSAYGIQNDQCAACTGNTYLDPSSVKCMTCPIHCSTCVSASECTKCDTEYGLYNKYCVICPGGTALSNGVCVTSTNAGGEPEPVPEPEPTPTPAEETTEELTASQAAQSKAINKGRTATDATTQITTIASNGDSAGAQAQISGRIFFSIQYFNITYSEDVLAILKATQPKPGNGDPAYVPNIPSDTKEEIERDARPYMFDEYNVPDSFMLNFWKKLILAAIVLAVVLVFLGVEYLLARCKCKLIPAMIPTLIRSGAQNYLLTQVYSFMGDVILYSTLEWRSIYFRQHLVWLSFLLSLFFMGVVVALLTWHFRFTAKYQRIKRQAKDNGDKELLTKFSTNNQGVKLFFESFKDEFRDQQHFLTILTGRDMIFSLLLTTLFEHPLAQILILFALNIAMFVYLIKRKPFKDIFNLIQQFFYETLFFLALVILLISFALDNQGVTDMHPRNVLGNILIKLSLIFTYGTMIIMVGKFSNIAYKTIKEKRAEAEKAKQAKYLQDEEAKLEVKREGSSTDKDSSPQFSEKMDSKLRKISLNSPSSGNSSNIKLNLTDMSPIGSHGDKPDEALLRRDTAFNTGGDTKRPLNTDLQQLRAGPYLSELNTEENESKEQAKREEDFSFEESTPTNYVPDQKKMFKSKTSSKFATKN